MTLAFDTSVFVYAADADAGTRHAMASELVAGAARSGGAVLILQTLAEFFSVVTRRSLADPDEPVFSLTLCDDGCRSTASPSRISTGRSRRYTPWPLVLDGLLWATADRAGVRYLLSEDFQDRRRLGGVIFVNPFEEANRPLIERALPPRLVPPT